MNTIAIVVGGAFAGWVWARNRRRGRKKDDALGVAAQILGGGSSAEGRAWGDRLGLAMEVRFISRNDGWSISQCTRIDVELPRGYPLALNIRRYQRQDHGGIARGEVIDLKLDDPEFDRTFLVEAAPSDVAKRLIDADARSFLMCHRMFDLFDARIGDRHVIRLEAPGWVLDPVKVRVALEFLARLGLRVREVFAAEERDELDGATSGSPYRPEPDAAAERVEREKRDQELEAIRVIRMRRRLFG
jgi:hypothetical protein